MYWNPDSGVLTRGLGIHLK